MSLVLGRPLFGSRALARLWRFLTRDAALATLATVFLWSARLVYRGACGLPTPRPQPGRYLGRGPRTPGHRVQFWHADLTPEPARLAVYAATLQGSPGAPFTLICRRRRLGHNSWLHEAVHDGDPDGAAWLAPADMMALGVSAGGEVLVQTTSATLRMPALSVTGVPQGIVVVPHGVPGINVNALIPTGVTMLEPLSGQHHMTGIVVQVTRAPQTAVMPTLTKGSELPLPRGEGGG
jgi:anaerobic selenocysteine-containing dehydrogenase